MRNVQHGKTLNAPKTSRIAKPPSATSFSPSLRPSRRAILLGLPALAVICLGAFGWWQRSVGQMTDEALLARAEARPTDAQAQRALARRLLERGEKAAAVAAFGRVVALQPGDLAARRELARLLLEMGRRDEALIHFYEVAKRDPGDALAQQQMGEFYLARGALSWAADALEQAVATQPQNAQAWMLLGRVHLERHQATQAVQALTKACQLAPSRPDYRVALGRAYLEAGQWEQAETTLQREARGEAAAEAAYWLGVLYTKSFPGRKSREREATHWLSRSCQQSPHTPEPFLALGKLMLQQRKPRLAVPLLEHAADRMPGRPDPLFHLARAYRESGRAAQARACLQRFERLSQFQRERHNLELRLVQTPNDPALIRRLADLFARNGFTAQADSLRRRLPEGASRAERLRV